MNLTRGGKGPKSGVPTPEDVIQKRKEAYSKRTDEYKQKIKNKVKTTMDRKGPKAEADRRRRISEAQIGVKLSAETKRKISKALTGCRNGRYGQHWVTDGVSNKIIPKDSKIPDGFKKGRAVSEETKRKISKTLKNKNK